jgi:hypothetical protein
VSDKIAHHHDQSIPKDIESSNKERSTRNSVTLNGTWKKHHPDKTKSVQWFIKSAQSESINVSNIIILLLITLKFKTIYNFIQI